MLSFNEGACHVLADDTRASLEDVDAAIGTQARMMTTMIETFAGSGIPARRSQRMYSRLYDAMGHILTGRSAVVDLVAELQVTQRHSNVAETSFGCSSPWKDAVFAPAGSIAVEKPLAPPVVAS